MRESPRFARALAGRWVTALPSMNTAPVFGRVRPEITLNSVVLPAPLGPMMPVTAPASAVRFTPVNAAMPPNSTETLRTSSALAKAELPA